MNTYRPQTHCTIATISQFTAEANRLRQAFAEGRPFSMFTLRGWELKNPAALEKLCGERAA